MNLRELHARAKREHRAASSNSEREFFADVIALIERVASGEQPDLFQVTGRPPPLFSCPRCGVAKKADSQICPNCAL